MFVCVLSGERDGVSTGERVWGWQRHHTLITLCIFSLTIFLPVCVHACLCMPALGHALPPLFGAQLRLYPLTQNTVNTSNLVAHSGSLHRLWQSLRYPKKTRDSQPMQTLTTSQGTKNTLFQITHTAHGQLISKLKCLHFKEHISLSEMCFTFRWWAVVMTLWTYNRCVKHANLPFSNIQFVHMLSKSVIPFNWLLSFF